MRAEETSSMVNELPSKIDDFLEVKFSFGNTKLFSQQLFLFTFWGDTIYILIFQYVNKIYFDGQLDFSAKEGLKKGLEKKETQFNNQTVDRSDSGKKVPFSN